MPVLALAAGRVGGGASRVTRGASRLLGGASRVTRGAGRVTRGASRVTRRAGRVVRPPGRITASPAALLAPSAALRAKEAVMDMTIAQLVEQTGVASRTLREWIRLELLPRPAGNGPAALYSGDHLLRIWAILGLRREGLGLSQTKRAARRDVAAALLDGPLQAEEDAGAASPAAGKPVLDTAGRRGLRRPFELEGRALRGVSAPRVGGGAGGDGDVRLSRGAPQAPLRARPAHAGPRADGGLRGRLGLRAACNGAGDRGEVRGDGRGEGRGSGRPGAEDAHQPG